MGLGMKTQVILQVVSIFNYVNRNGPYAIEIYSLRTNSWKMIEDSHRGFPNNELDKFANCKLHWSAVCGYEWYLFLLIYWRRRKMRFHDQII